MWKWQRKASRVVGIVSNVIKLIDCRRCVELCLPKSTTMSIWCSNVRWRAANRLNGAKPSSSSVFFEVSAAINVFMRTLNCEQEENDEKIYSQRQIVISYGVVRLRHQPMSSYCSQTSSGSTQTILNLYWTLKIVTYQWLLKFLFQFRSFENKTTPGLW